MLNECRELCRLDGFASRTYNGNGSTELGYAVSVQERADALCEQLAGCLKAQLLTLCDDIHVEGNGSALKRLPKPALARKIVNELTPRTRTILRNEV